MSLPFEKPLSDEQVQQFLHHGVLVVPNILSQSEVTSALEGMQDTLRRHGVLSFSVNDEASARAFSNLSSTNGSGGVLDLFYETWKLDIATNIKLWSITQQLWAAAYCHEGESRESLPQDDVYRWHPYGAFDCKKGYLYMDRIGFRLPTKLAQELGALINPEKKKKARNLQRSLTPHLDCCPENLFNNATKWRPIQCFVSLTDNMEPNSGGFEAARGFHREFEHWAKTRPPTVLTQKNADGMLTESKIAAPCIGQYTHIRPKEDKDVMDRVKHIPVPAGSAVLWDNRLPHANAYRHLGDTPRVVVYCSFLPDVEINRKYMQQQLDDFQNKRPPRDQWNNMNDDRLDDWKEQFQDYKFTPLGRRLMGMDPWE